MNTDIKKRLKNAKFMVIENKTTLLLLFLMIVLGVAFFIVFYNFNNIYLAEINNGGYENVSHITDNLFYTYFSIILYTAIYIVCTVMFTIKRFQEKTDYYLVLILWYLVLFLFARVNDINTGMTVFQKFINMISDSIYELSTVPLVLYVILKMKDYSKHMQLILLLECLSSLFYVIGYVVDDNNFFSVFKNVGCSSVFIITLVVLHFFAAIEIREGNRQMRRYIISELTIVLIYFVACVIAIISRNDFSNALADSWSSLIYDIDLLPLRKTLLQDVFILSIFLDYCLIIIFDYTQEIEKRKAIELELKLSDRYNAISQGRVREVRKLKHDLMEHINVANMYCKQGEYQKLEEYLASLGAQTMALPSLAYSSNSTCDYVIMYYSEKCKEAGIEFTGSAPVGDELGLTDSEITSLLSNILKNAYEACLAWKAKGGDKPFVRFNMYVINGKLNIRCENSSLSRAQRDENGRFKTTKADFEQHGLGIDIAASICERHNGAAVFQLQGSVFRVSATMPIVSEKNKK